jgi:hypothetical protein
MPGDRAVAALVAFLIGAFLLDKLGVSFLADGLLFVLALVLVIMLPVLLVLFIRGFF